MNRAILIGGLLLTLASGIEGCAGTRTYPNGINHCYLCAVRVARLNGYQIREQDFHPKAGDLVAARSIPDPKETKISRGFFRKWSEVFWNLWEHSKFELWDEDLAAARVKTEERFVVSFTSRAGWPLGWLGVTRARETRIKVELDVTDYGREEWVINREPLKPAERERVYKQIADCLAYASPTAYATAAKKARVVPAAEVQPAPVALAPAPSSTAAVATAVPSSTVIMAAPAASATQAVPGVAMSATTVVTAVPVVVEAPKAPPLSADAIAALLGKGKASYEAGKFDEAIPVLEKVVVADPESAEAFGYLGAAYYQRRRLDDAIRAYEAYVRLVPSDQRTQSFIETIRKEKAQPK